MSVAPRSIVIRTARTLRCRGRGNASGKRWEMSFDDASGPGGTGRPSPLPADLAAGGATLVANVEAWTDYGVTQLDGPAAAELAAAMTAAANRLTVLGARGLPIVEADG